MTCPHCGRELSEHGEKDQCLNAWAAKLAGWTLLRFDKSSSGLQGWLGRPPDTPLIARPPSYITSLADAFALLDAFPQWNFYKFGDTGNEPYYIEVNSNPRGWEDERVPLYGGNTPALTITKAFIAAKEPDNA